MRIEAKVGLFVVIGFVMLLGLSTQLSLVRNIGQEGYKIFVNISDASGLNIHAKVKMNGVDAGEVQAIDLDKGQVRLTIFINNGIEVPKDSTVSLQQESMLGGKIINIEAGKDAEYLSDHEAIEKTSTLASFDQTSQKIYDAADSFTELMNSANEILDEQRRNSMKESIDNLAIAMKDIKELVSDNKLLVHDTIEGYKLLADEFTMTGKDINKWLPGFEDSADQLLVEYTKAGKSLNELIGDNAKPLNKAITATEEFFATGQSALVKVDRYLASLTESELQVSMYGWAMANDGDIKVYISLVYLPEPQTYYILKVASLDDYSNRDASGNLIAPQLHDEGEYRFTAEYGKRFNSILARAGLQDSTGSAGLDYFGKNDRLKISWSIFDLNAINDVRGVNPHMHLGLKYELTKHVNFFAGVDNFINSEAMNFYMGLGMEFVDDHLKYFISGTGTP
jgi:phospholipid/cholesterol/gamma-HCH transport system substrate-binding protein